MVKPDGGRQESDGVEPPVIGAQQVASVGIRVDRVIYTTISLMSILIVYDGWATLRFWGVVAVIVGPMLAIVLGHIFGAALGTRVERGRPLTRRERRNVLVKESRLLLLVVPPLGMLVVLRLVGMSYTRIIQVIVIAGVLWLGFWGGLAGRRARLTGWALVASVAYGLVVGGLILVLQALLRPGQGNLRQ
jgi:hypothetical protein